MVGIRDFIEISHLTYQELYEVKVVKIIRTLDPFKSKKGKGKHQKREWSSDQKRKSK